MQEKFGNLEILLPIYPTRNINAYTPLNSWLFKIKFKKIAVKYFKCNGAVTFKG